MLRLLVNYIGICEKTTSICLTTRQYQKQEQKLKRSSLRFSESLQMQLIIKQNNRKGMIIRYEFRAMLRGRS